MGTLNDQLHSFLDDKAFFAPVSKKAHHKNCLVFSEKNQAGSCFTVIGVPDNLVVLKGDLFMPLLLEQTSNDGKQFRGSTYFKETSGAARRADFILLDEVGNNIVFLELKSNTGEVLHIQDQLIGAHAVLDYIRRVGAHYLNVDWESFLGSGYSYHYAGVCKTSYSIRKKPTRPSVSGKGGSVKDFRKFSGVTKVYYRNLC